MHVRVQEMWEKRSQMDKSIVCLRVTVAWQGATGTGVCVCVCIMWVQKTCLYSRTGITCIHYLLSLVYLRLRLILADSFQWYMSGY